MWLVCPGAALMKQMRWNANLNNIAGGHLCKARSSLQVDASSQKGEGENQLLIYHATTLMRSWHMRYCLSNAITWIKRYKRWFFMGRFPTWMFLQYAVMSCCRAVTIQYTPRSVNPGHFCNASKILQAHKSLQRRKKKTTCISIWSLLDVFMPRQAVFLLASALTSC